MERMLVDHPGERPVGVVGAGLIGLGWAALFVHRGHWVRAFDPDPLALTRLGDEIDGAIAEIEAIDGSRRAGGRLERLSSLSKAMDSCAYIQESAPERITVKREVLAAITETAAPEAVIGSSTSSLTAMELGEGQVGPGRIVVAHPFNPPHLIPLVEIGGRDDNAGPAVEFACDLFNSLGRVPVRIRRPVRGHIANRLSAALFREAVYLVQQGIASVEDVDMAVRYGPGLRWASAGPFLNYHLGAGSGGLAAYLDHLGPAQEARWADLGCPTLDGEAKLLLVDGMAAAAGGADIHELARRRANRLAAIRRALAASEGEP